MNPFETISGSPLVYRLGCGLLHFLWQGSLMAVILALAMRILRGRSPGTRYLTAWTALLAMAVSVPITAWLISPPPVTETRTATVRPRNVELPIDSAETDGSTRQPERIDGAESPGMVHIPAAPGPMAGPAVVSTAPAEDPQAATRNPLAARASQWIRPALPWIVCCWVVGALALSLWRLSGWIYLRRLCQLGTSPAPDAAGQMLERLRKRLQIKPAVRLLKSTLVEVPTLIGWLRPVILLPASILAELPVEQLEMILAHELAHVRRHDFLLNLVQTAIETLLFYHPAVWWVSRRIRIEREACCDEVAVAGCGDRLLYARALMKLEGLRHESAGILPAKVAVAADGAPLLWRIRRVLRLPGDDQEGCRAWLGGSLAVVLLVGVLVAYAAIGDEPLARPAEQAPAEKGAGNARANGSTAKQPTIGKPTKETSDPLAREVYQIMAKADGLAVWQDRRNRVYLRSLSDEELAKLYGSWAAQGGIAFDIALGAVRKNRPAIIDRMLKQGGGPKSEADQPAFRQRREKLVTELAAFGPDAVPILLREMDRGIPPNPLFAREALVKMGAPAVEPLTKLWKDPGAPREAVIDVLSELADPRSKDIFLAALDDQSDWIRSCACGGLLRLGPEVVGRDRLQTILIAKLEDADCLHDALSGLAEYGDKAAVEPLRVFAQHWPGRGKADLRRSAHLAIRDILRRVGEPVPESLKGEIDSWRAQSAEELYAAAACSNAAIRQLAIQRLSDRRDGRTVRFLLKRLQEESAEDVVDDIYFALGLCVLRPRNQDAPAVSASAIQDAFDALVGAARDSKGMHKEAAVSAARTVVHAAGQAKTRLQGVGRFKDLIRDGLRLDRREMMTSYYSAITAVAVTAGSATTGWSAEEREQLQEELLPGLKAARPDIRLIECLGLIGDQRAGASLTELLGHEDAMVRQFAASALGGIRYPAALPGLRRLADSDPARYENGIYHVREAAAGAIRAIEEKRSPKASTAAGGTRSEK